MCAQAIRRALDDAGLEPADIDGIMYRPMGGSEFDEADFHHYFGTTHDMWVSRQGGGMRWAATAPAEAAEAIGTGLAHHVVNSFAVAWATQRGEMVGGPGQSHAENLLKQNLEVPFGMFPQPVYAALMARRHMAEFGTTEDQLAAVAITMRSHANRSPTAVMRDRTMTVDDYFSSPVVADPLRRFDCCPISDGGGAYIVSDAEAARDLRHRVVTVGGVGLAASDRKGFWSLEDSITTTPVSRSAPAAFAMAGVGPGDLDVIGCYDPFTIITLISLEDTGVCERGEAGVLAEQGALHYLSGRIPTNTDGGLHSHAYVLGIAHVVELVRQLRGEASAQVPNAEIGAYVVSTGAEGATLVLRREP